MKKPTIKETVEDGKKILMEQHYCVGCGKKTNLYACEQYKSGKIDNCEPIDSKFYPFLNDDLQVSLTYEETEYDVDKKLSDKILETSGIKELIDKNSYDSLVAKSGYFGYDKDRKNPPEFHSEECMLKFLKKNLK